jgi:regulatory protein
MQLSAAREIALRLLTVRARSREELRKAMDKRRVPPDVAAEVLARFGEVGLIDDASFAQAWVESGQRRGRSRLAIAQELRTKGVADAEISQALETMDEDADYAAAKALAEKKLRSLGALDRQVAYRRIGGALMRRGFSCGLAARVLKEVLPTSVSPLGDQE